MKKFFKIVFRSIAVIFLVTIATMLILRYKYPPKKIQALVLNKLELTLHRQVRLASAELGLRGLSLHGLEISEEPNFRAGTLLKAQTIRVRPRILALLRHRIELADVLLSEWDCNVIHRANGTWNIQSSTVPPSSPKRAKVANSKGASADVGVLAAAWNVDRIRLGDGTVHYADRATDAHYSLKNIQISAKHLRPEGNFPLALSMDYYSGKVVEGHVDLHGVVNLGGLNPTKMDVQWDSLTLRHLGLNLESSGQIKNLTAPELSMKASIPKQRLNPEFVSRWPQWLPMITPIQGTVELHKTGNTINLRQVNIVWNSLRAEMQGRVQLMQKGFPAIHLEVKTGNFSLSDMTAFLPPAHRVKPQGQGNIELVANGPANAPALSGQASLRDVAVVYEGQSLSGLQAAAKFSPQIITVQAQGVWNRGNFQLSLNARNYRTVPDLQLTGQLSELDLESLPGSSPAPAPKAKPEEPAETRNQATSPTPLHTSGQFTFGKIIHPKFMASKTTCSWDLKNANDPSRITGSTKFNVGQGRFDDLKDVGGQNDLIKALLLPFTMLQKLGSVSRIAILPKFDRVNFKSITGDYSFQRGLMTIRESHLDSDAAYVTALGKANLGQETLDLRITTRLAIKGVTGPIGIKVGGTFSNPMVKVDAAAILQQPAVNQVIQQGTKYLKNLFK